MKVVIFGGSGFIGKNLLEQLNKSYRILAPSHKEVDLLDELTLKAYLKKHQPDVVIDCALFGGQRNESNPEVMFYQNLRMFFNLVKCKPFFKKMIYFGSGLEYGRDSDIKKIKEEDFGKKIPLDERGLLKYICSKYIEKNDEIINLRIFGLFGKYEDYKLRFISNAICRKLLGLPITLNQDVYFDYVYINDFVKIVDHFIRNKPKYKYYNIGTGKPVNLLTIADKINKLSKNNTKITVKTKGLNNEYTCDNSRLLKEIKGLKFTDFDESLKELFKWYEGKKKTIGKKTL